MGLGNQVMKVARQPGRDAACGLIFICAVAYYIRCLEGYVSAMHRPVLLILGFVGSLMLALLHDMRRSQVRLSAIRCARTAIIFAVAVIAAGYVRDEYLTMRAAIAGLPEAQAFLGPDAYSALANPFVGYGGCFALGLLVIRWVAGAKIERFLMAALLLPELFPKTCPHCANEI